MFSKPGPRGGELRAQVLESEKAQLKLVALYHFGIIDLWASVEKILGPLSWGMDRSINIKHFTDDFKVLTDTFWYLSWASWLVCPLSHSHFSKVRVIRLTDRSDGGSTEISMNIQCSNIVSPRAPFPTWATVGAGWKWAPETRSQASLCDSQTLLFYEPWSPLQENGIIDH